MIKELSIPLLLKLKLQNLFIKRHGKDIRRTLTRNNITGKYIKLEDLTGLETRPK